MNPYKQARRLLKLAQVVERQEGKFDMSAWVKVPDKSRFSSNISEVCGILRAATPRELATKADATCGMTACMGGWAVITWSDEVELDGDIYAEALKVLGYTDFNVGNLFDAHAPWQDAEAAAAELRRRAIELIKTI